LTDLVLAVTPGISMRHARSHWRATEEGRKIVVRWVEAIHPAEVTAQP